MAPALPILSPGGYFERLDRPSLSVAAGIVILQAVAICVILYVFLQEVVARVAVPPEAAGTVQSKIGSVMAGTFFGIVVGWILLSAVLHAFVWFSDSDRGFGTTLAVVGEAEVVTFVFLPVTAAVLFSKLGGVPSDPQAAAEFFRRLAAFNSPLLTLVSLITTGWKAVIQGIGLSIAQGIPVGKALTLTIVVGAIGFLLSLA